MTTNPPPSDHSERGTTAREIPEAAGRPCIIEWHGERREAGTIERATANEDDSITVYIQMKDGFAHYDLVKEDQEQDPLRRIPTYPNCATCDGGGCGDCA